MMSVSLGLPNFDCVCPFGSVVEGTVVTYTTSLVTMIPPLLRVVFGSPPVLAPPPSGSARTRVLVLASREPAPLRHHRAPARRAPRSIGRRRRLLPRRARSQWSGARDPSRRGALHSTPPAPD